MGTEQVNRGDRVTLWRIVLLLVAADVLLITGLLIEYSVSNRPYYCGSTCPGGLNALAAVAAFALPALIGLLVVIGTVRAIARRVGSKRD